MKLYITRHQYYDSKTYYLFSKPFIKKWATVCMVKLEDKCGAHIVYYICVVYNICAFPHVYNVEAIYRYLIYLYILINYM